MDSEARKVSKDLSVQAFIIMDLYYFVNVKLILPSTLKTKTERQYPKQYARVSQRYPSPEH